MMCFDYERAAGKKFAVFDIYTGWTFYICTSKTVALQLCNVLGGVI